LKTKIYLSPPETGLEERELVCEALDTNWVAPAGPHLPAFEREVCDAFGAGHAVALNSGTAALHLALRLAGVRPGDEVLVSDLTFTASANPVLYEGGRPVFIDSEERSWNIDPAVFAETVERKVRAGRPPRAAVIVDVLGQCADWTPLLATCRKNGIFVIEDAAESVGATYGKAHAGTFGDISVYSFNGNKILTTGGGGMLLSRDAKLVARAHKLATQAREPAPHYEHAELGFNYRLSNVLAGIGRAQLRKLPAKIQARRRVFEFYRKALRGLPGVSFMPEARFGRATRWLSCIRIDPDVARATREAVRLALEKAGVESRAIWKPLHMQPLYDGAEFNGRGFSEILFAEGLCLPSGGGLSAEELGLIVDVVRGVLSR
jgi:pyridoxal phosphate-dependent aminotransferase EpsN